MSFRRILSYLAVGSRLMVAALAGWTALVITELVLLFGAIRVLAWPMPPDLLPSLKFLFDMSALAACGWTAARVGSPRVMAAASLAATGLAVYDFTPYLPLNFPWVFRLAKNALSDSYYMSPLFEALTVHATVWGSLFIGAQISRPRRAPMNLGIGR